jgi:hypothetical protein
LSEAKDLGGQIESKSGELNDPKNQACNLASMTTMWYTSKRRIRTNESSVQISLSSVFEPSQPEAFLFDMLLNSIIGSPQDSASIQLATRSGEYIENVRPLERAYETLKAAERIWKEKFPLIQTRSLTAVYNCVGLVFASRRTAIDPSLIDWILREDGYRQVLPPEGIQPGDIVVYRLKQQPAHIAVIIASSADSFGRKLLMVMSQWGSDGEYIHPVEDVPEELLGKPTDYWTDRKEHNES